MKCLAFVESVALEYTRLRMALVIISILGASGQLALPIAQAEDRTVSLVESEQDRDRLYDDLARDFAQLEQSLSIVQRVAHVVRPTVVHIEATKSREYEYGTSSSVDEAGSGVLVDIGNRAYLLTNRHVIRGATPQSIKVQLHDGRLVKPRTMWEDEKTDVAVMALPDLEGLIPARLGNSNQVDIGEFCVAVGSPFGLSQSVTFGMVSAKGRYDLKLGDGEVEYQNFLQTDAAINPGNSGGPLINLRGEVVGLNTAIASSSGGNEGIGFAIPINTAIHIARQLIENGRVDRAFLGVSLDKEYSAARFAVQGESFLRGARVSSITPESPAADADIHEGDVILYFDGNRIADENHLINVVGLSEVGREIEIVLLRQGEAKRINVQVGNKSSFARRE